jgi:hypothetical protein
MFNEISFKFAFLQIFLYFLDYALRPRVATQTAQIGRPSASVWIAWLEMP